MNEILMSRHNYDNKPHLTMDTIIHDLTYATVAT